MTVRDALARAVDLLAAHGVETPQVDAEFLLAHVLGSTRTQLQLDGSRPLDAGERDRFDALVDRRARREPLAYVLGEWGFRRLTLRTDRRALVPRPETEVLVERCLELLRGTSAPRVLDVGAGSGAVALAIADEHPAARVTAVDVSEDALALARENADRLSLDVDLRAGGFDAATEGWDLVVSNPPYVSERDYEHVQPEIREWEPRAAVVGQGLHEELARVARTTWLVLEVGDGQAPAVAEALRVLGYSDVAITRDLAGRERVVEGRR